MTAISIRNVVTNSLKEYKPTTISTYRRGWNPAAKVMIYEVYVTGSKQKLIDTLEEKLLTLDIPIVKVTKKSVVWESEENLIKAVLTTGSIRKGIWRISCVGPHKPLPPLSTIDEEQA